METIGSLEPGSQDLEALRMGLWAAAQVLINRCVCIRLPL